MGNSASAFLRRNFCVTISVYWVGEEREMGMQHIPAAEVGQLFEELH